MNIKYETPQIEVVEVEVEQGFSVSIGFTDEPANNDFDII